MSGKLKWVVEKGHLERRNEVEKGEFGIGKRYFSSNLEKNWTFISV